MGEAKNSFICLIKRDTLSVIRRHSRLNNDKHWRELVSRMSEMDSDQKDACCDETENEGDHWNQNNQETNWLSQSLGSRLEVNNGPQIRVTTPRRSRQNGVQVIEVTKCCTFLKCFPCLRGLRIWLVQDVCGYVCVAMTWSLILYALFVVFLLLHNAEFGIAFNLLNGLIFTFFALLAGTSHLKAMTTDPGAIPIGNATPANIQRMGLKENQVVYKCAKCCSIKPERSHHCSVCQRCVRKMDHHCPWINNCVGENNQKFFVLFTFYIAIISLHVIALVAVLFIDCISIASDARSSRGRSSGQLFKDVQHHGVHGFFRRRPASALGVNETLDGSDADRDPVCGAFSRPLYVVLVILLVFEALLFSIFTAVMCLSQLCSICKDETGIEALKKEGGSLGRKSRWTNIKSVFGSPFSVKWFSPFHMPNTNMGKLEPYQYCV